MAKVVTAAVVVVKGEDGLQRYYYQGSTLPDELPKDEVQRLVDAGMVSGEKELTAQPDGAAAPREAKPAARQPKA
ncbi:hypothetical protein CO540_13285 [Micromonospora sp. WMMA2032]|uniref:hypothetical protein n=1 Tax=Micromonospora sp. WMMA2032 TaxID=2039870 RepID=UPI000C05A208|nr:hypothetical protein [Micromonospora sp. WMMA2032]ATO14681.1 hypothetical protein CO540_13285 [Micromonospora sp. WMMA2032]